MKSFAPLIIVCFSLSLQAQFDNIVINEIIPPGTIELKNTGATMANISGLWLCDFPDYVQLANLTLECGSINLMPGGFVTLSGFNFLDTGDGELGLYSDNNFGDPADIVDYVEWGSSGHARSIVAAEGGIWTFGDFVPAFNGCQSLEYDGEGNSSTDWMSQNLATSPCLENTLDGCVAGGACMITDAGLTDLICNDNGTPSDPSDDIIIFNLDPAGTDLGTLFSVSLSSGTIAPAGGIYGIVSTFELQPGSAGGGATLLTITDGTDPSCTFDVGVEDPGSCSNVCFLTDLGMDDIACDDNGTPFDPIDDVITFTLNPTGTNLGETYSVSVSGAVVTPSIGGYGVITTFALEVGTAGQGNFNLTVSDDGDTTCILGGTITDPGICSFCDVAGGTISTMDSTTICAGNGLPDEIDIALSGQLGSQSAWIITDTNGVILGLPPGPPFDFENAGSGECQIWHLSFEPGLAGLQVENNIADLEGCFEFSNGISVTRLQPEGGEISTTDSTVVCAGDGTADTIHVTVTGSSGTNMAYVITDTSGNILGLPTSQPFDFEGAGAGVCLIWNLSYEDGLTGLSSGNSIDSLAGCFDFSNAIEVIRLEGEDCISCAVEGGEITTTDSTVVCAGDGNADTIHVTVTGSSGTNMAYVITDTSGNILGLPTSQPFDFEDAGTGVCLIWNLSYEDGLTGLSAGNNIDSLIGCFDFSNAMQVIRLEGGECTTATDDIELESTIMLYPNPATHMITIESLSDILEVELMDMQGRILFKIGAPGVSSSLHLDINDRAPGLYWAQIFTLKGIFLKKFIKSE